MKPWPPCSGHSSRGSSLGWSWRIALFTVTQSRPAPCLVPPGAGNSAWHTGICGANKRTAPAWIRSPPFSPEGSCRTSRAVFEGRSVRPAGCPPARPPAPHCSGAHPVAPHPPRTPSLPPSEPATLPFTSEVPTTPTTPPRVTTGARASPSAHPGAERRQAPGVHACHPRGPDSCSAACAESADRAGGRGIVGT